MKIYISNLDTKLKSEDLKNLFSQHGEVESAEVSIDAFTEKSRGFGFVEMPKDEEAQKAIQSLNQSEFSGNVISVEESPLKELHKGSYKVGSGAVNAYRFRKN